MIASNCRPSLLQCGVLHHSRLLWSWLATVYSFSKLIVVGMQKYLLLGRQEVTALNGQHLRIASFDVRSGYLSFKMTLLITFYYYYYFSDKTLHAY